MYRFSYEVASRAAGAGGTGQPGSAEAQAAGPLSSSPRPLRRAASRPRIPAPTPPERASPRDHTCTWGFTWPPGLGGRLRPTDSVSPPAALGVAIPELRRLWPESLARPRRAAAAGPSPRSPEARPAAPGASAPPGQSRRWAGRATPSPASKPPTSPGWARAGIGFPCARNPAFAPSAEHPRFFASQEKETSWILVS